MRFDLMHVDSLCRVDHKHATDEVARPLREGLGHEIDTGLDLAEEFTNVFVIKRQVARQQCVEDDSAGPNVRGGTYVAGLSLLLSLTTKQTALCTIVFLAADNFGRRVVG